MTTIYATYTDEWKPMVDLVEPLWREYADRHGYQLKLVLCDNHFPPYHYSFTKTFFVSQWLKNGGSRFVDSTFVIDLDMIPTNMNHVLERTICRSGARGIGSVAMGKDINGWNSGAYFVSNLPYNLSWLDTIVNLRGVTTSEQHAMWLINEPFDVSETEAVNFIPYEEYEGFEFQRKAHYSQWEPGDFTLHLPGMTNEKRMELFAKYIPLIQR